MLDAEGEGRRLALEDAVEGGGGAEDELPLRVDVVGEEELGQVEVAEAFGRRRAGLGGGGETRSEIVDMETLAAEPSTTAEDVGKED
jgi:hypothetical protein